MNTEAVLLTGGASTRMGFDKASILVAGKPLAERIVAQLNAVGVRVTVLGQTPVMNADFLADVGTYEGPLVALSRFRATSEFVIVASCDLPNFDARVAEILVSAIGEADAAIPIVDGKLQPLCALYRSSAFDSIDQVLNDGSRRIMTWIERLNIVEVPVGRFEARGLGRSVLQGVNTPQELAAAMSELT